MVLHHITNLTGDGNEIRLAYRIKTPDLFAPNYYHCSDERSSNLVLLTGFNSDYNRNVTVNDIGIPVNIDFINRGKLRILLEDIGGKEFDSEADSDTNITADGFHDKTHYKLVLLFKPIPDSLA